MKTSNHFDKTNTQRQGCAYWKRRGAPLFKSNRIFFSVSNDCINFQCIDLKFFMWHDEIFLHLFCKISWLYVIASRLCEYSNLIRFEKRAAKPLQHGHRYGDILMLYKIINTYEWFFCYNWDELCSSSKFLESSSIQIFFLVKYAIQISTMNHLLPYLLLCWRATSVAGGLRSGNQLILGNAKQYSDMKFLNISR